MKRFLVFSYQSYYPSGGFQDFDSAHETFAEAQKARQANHNPYKGSHIVDLTTFTVVESQYEQDPIKQQEP